MSPINLSNVNITIQQFQAIASGKYNAGEVRLKSATSLGKINDHVILRGDNNVSLSHAEVLAIKDAFVRALQQNGVGNDAIDRIRRELGLGPDGASDVSLAKRSIKPLSRQQIRTILDANAATINAHAGAGTIRSHAEIYARYSKAERAGFARTRREINAELVCFRATAPDTSIQDIQAVLSGDIHFRSAAEVERLIAAAESQKALILERSNGNPSNDPGATVAFTRREDGLNVTLALGGSEADAIRRLDDELIQLRSIHQPSNETLAVRGEFRRLPNAARSAWVANLANDPRGGFKARTIAVGLLFERGVSDWATLSLVNRISDAAAITLLSNLVDHSHGLRGDALRQSPAVAGLAGQVNQQPIPDDRQAYIPALSPREANEAAINALKFNENRLSHEMKTMRDGVLAGFRARFGEGAVPQNARFSNIVESDVIASAFGNLENDVRRDPEQIKAAILAEGARWIARRFLANAIKPMLMAAGGDPGMSAAVAANLFVRHPELAQRLAAATTPDEAQATVEAFHQQIGDGIRRQMTADRLRTAAVGWYRETIAEALGVPASALAGNTVNVSRITNKGEQLAANIGLGVNPADDDEEIEQAYRTLAQDLANERIALLNQANAFQISPEARDFLKGHLLGIGKVTGLDLAVLKQQADAIPVGNLAAAFANGDKDVIIAQMGNIGTLVKNAAFAAINGQAGMLDEINDAGNLILIMALAKHPELFDQMRAFFVQSDIKNQDLAQVEGPAANAGVFLLFKPNAPAAASNAALADSIGQLSLAPLPAQAIYQAFNDLGLGDLSANDKTNLLLGLDGEALARQVRAAKNPVSPTQLRGLAQMQFAQQATFHAATRWITALAKENGIDSTDIAGFSTSVVFDRNPGLREQIATALARAAARGEDPRAAAETLLASHADTALIALRTFAEIRNVNATARETAVREIAARANLDQAVVNEKLDAGGLRDSLSFLRSDISDELSNPATDITAWDPAAVGTRAAERVESFIANKVSFLAEVVALPLPDAVRGSIVLSTLLDRTYKDPDLAAAARRVLQRDEILAAFDYASNMLTPDKVEQLSDQDIFTVFENVGAQLNAAIEAELPADKRAGMDNDDHAAIRSLLGAAFVGYCGDTILAAAARLAATGRLDTIDDVGNAVHHGYDSEFMTYSSGINSRGQRVQPDLVKAAAVNKSVAAAALGLRLLNTMSAALDDDWLPAALADAVRTGVATPEQNARASALVKRAPTLVANLGAGLDPAKAARFKAFAITLDYRDQALAATEETLRAAVEAIRTAASPEQAEARLSDLAGAIFAAPDAAAFVAAAALSQGIDLDEVKSAKAAALLAEFADGIPVRNARLLANFIVNLKLSDQSAETDRQRVETIAPQIAGWRDFKLEDPGKEQICAFFKDEANVLILDYERPADKAKEFSNDISKTMVVDLGRGIYTIAGKRFNHNPPAEALAEFNRVVTTPKARRALSILMSQASALPVLSLQMKFPQPPNSMRPQPLDTGALPGAGEFVSRGMADPALFIAQQVVDDITSIFDLTVSEDGTTATLKIVKSGKMVVGTADQNMHTYFGSVVVEEELTVDLTADVPTVTNVRTAQRFSDELDLMERYLAETEPIPQPPAQPPPVPRL